MMHAAVTPTELEIIERAYYYAFDDNGNHVMIHRNVVVDPNNRYAGFKFRMHQDDIIFWTRGEFFRYGDDDKTVSCPKFIIDALDELEALEKARSR